MKTLKRSILVVFSLIAMVACQKEDVDPTDDDPFSGAVYSGVSVKANVVYGSSTTQGGVSENLLMDVYAPEGDNNLNRPLIILAHGGGFLGGEKESMADLSGFLASSGYVVASLKYRLVDVEETPMVMKKAVIDAVHDMRAAVRFFRKDEATINSYRIDKNNIFVGGYSAGAFMGLHTAYMNSELEVLDIGGDELLDHLRANGGAGRPQRQMPDILPL